MTIKKKIDLLKTKNILKNYPIILFFQHNNCTVADWAHLKTNIVQINGVKMHIIKNSIVQKILLNDTLVSPEKIKNLFQGPNFIIGCHNVEHIDSIFKLIKPNSNTIFIGGLFENQVINHLDLEKLLTLKHQAFSTNILLQQIISNNYSVYLNLLKSVNTNSYLNNLMLPMFQLVQCLNQLKNQKNKL